METKELLFNICGLMSVNGYEYSETEKLEALVSPYFDELQRDSVGNHIFIKRCGKPNAKKLFVDTHYDEIGLMVKDITSEGFLRVCGIGGVDARLLPCAEVVVYGKGKNLPGIALDKPAVIRNADEKTKLTPVTDILVDLGLPVDEVKKYVYPGAAVGFKPVYGELLDGALYGKGLDDKACSVAVVLAIMNVDAEKLGCDVYFSMSCREEVGHRAVSSAAYRIEPDAAIALDVTFGMAPEGKRGSDMKMGGGPVVCSALSLDRALTGKIIETAKEKEIPYQTSIEGARTATHADAIAFVGRGIPTALVSIPVWFMHTAVETMRAEDLENTARLLTALFEKEDLI